MSFFKQIFNQIELIMILGKYSWIKMLYNTQLL